MAIILIKSISLPHAEGFAVGFTDSVEDLTRSGLQKALSTAESKVLS
jgi:hypothetical protein